MEQLFRGLCVGLIIMGAIYVVIWNGRGKK